MLPDFLGNHSLQTKIMPDSWIYVGQSSSHTSMWYTVNKAYYQSYVDYFTQKRLVMINLH